MRYLSIIIIALTTTLSGYAQSVWPGDVNNNGVVNEIDFLYLGFAFNSSGTARTAASGNWEAQELPELWEANFPDGLNYAYADCNGDGQVNEADIAVIQQNLTLTHDDVPFAKDSILDATPAIDPGFFLENDIIAQPGITTSIDIALGNEDIQVNNLRGIAFTINLNPDFFDTDATEFDFGITSWLQPFGRATENIITNNPTTGETTIAFSTIDGEELEPGSGKIGELSFVIEAEVLDLLTKDDTLQISIDSITLVNNQLIKQPINTVKTNVQVEGRTTGATDPLLESAKMYPNPFREWLVVQPGQATLTEIALVNLLGKTIWQTPINTKNPAYSFNLKNIPSGFYWLRLISNKGVKALAVHKK